MDHHKVQDKIQENSEKQAGDALINKLATEHSGPASKLSGRVEISNGNTAEAHLPKMTLSGGEGKNGATEHKVKAGDSLWKISENHLKENHKAATHKAIQSMVDQIIQANKEHYPRLEKDPNRIDRSMTLIIPGEKVESKPADDKKAAKPAAATETQAKATIEKKPLSGQIPVSDAFAFGGEKQTAAVKDPGAEKPAAIKDPHAEKPVAVKDPSAEITGALKTEKPVMETHKQEHHPNHHRGHKTAHHEKSADQPVPKAPSQPDHQKPGHDKNTAPPQNHEAHGDSHGVMASWYHEGRKTANGEHFHPDGFTVASKTLPFGTKLEVTNPQNGHSVIVRVNDRGPFVKGRDLDLSRGAARQLGMLNKGVTKVDYRII